MSNAESKALIGPVSTGPKTDPSGTAEAIIRMIQSRIFLRALSQLCLVLDEVRAIESKKAELYQAIGRAFLELARIERRGRMPRGGRTRSAEVDAAMAMRAAGLSNKEIYVRLGKSGWQSQHALSEAMRQRRSRQRARGVTNGDVVTPTK